MVNQV